MPLTVKQIYTSSGECGKEEPGNSQRPFDVVVHMDNGEQYVASFFTYRNIEEIRKENQRTGACLNGLYFWSKNMVLVEDCNPKTVRIIVEGLLEDGEFGVVFERV